MYERKSRHLQQKLDILQGAVGSSRTEANVIAAKLRKSRDEVRGLGRDPSLVQIKEAQKAQTSRKFIVKV